MARVRRPRALLRQARAADGHRRRPDRLPAPHREARRAGRRDAAADGVRRLHGGRLSLRSSTASTTSRWSRATSRARTSVLVRVHSECLTGDVFHSLRCDCGEQLESALAMIESEGAACCCTSARRGAGSACSTSCGPTSSRTRALTRSRRTCVLGLPADLRDYGIGAQILVDLGLTSDPAADQQPQEDRRASRATACRSPTRSRSSMCPTRTTCAYLRAKRDKLGHTLHHQGLALDEELLQGLHDGERGTGLQNGEPEHDGE